MTSVPPDICEGNSVKDGKRNSVRIGWVFDANIANAVPFAKIWRDRFFACRAS
jgi:hypothetical protein